MSDTNPEMETSALRLSSYDVDRLLHDDSPKARSDILGKVAKQYRGQHFTPHELALAEQIFRIMMKDVELTVRQQLANEVKDIAVPRDIILHLAQDVEEVALPVIAMSEVLSDADLVYLVETSKETSKLEAVTKRPKLSERVSDALVDTHYPKVVQSLLKHENAKISGKAMDTVVRDFRRDPKILETLAMRDGLPLNIVEKLVHATSATMAAQLKEKYAVDTQKIEEAEQKVRESTMLKLLESKNSEEEIDALTAELAQENRLTPSIMLAALARGQVAFFVFALARLVHIPRENAMKLATDKGALGFKALYGKSELPEGMYEAVRALLHIVLDLREQGVKPDTRGYANMLATHLLMEAEKREIDNLPYMLALIRGK